MELSLESNELKDYIRRQAGYMFPDGYDLFGKDVDIAFDDALDRLEFCFKHITFPEYCDQKGGTFFSHLHADQYAQLLYFFSNSLWKNSENKALCSKLMYLNRSLHSVFISYKAKLPDIFFLGHPVGSIIGNADYSDYLVVFQNVTINTAGTLDDLLPKIGKGLFCAMGATIMGDKTIGDRVSIGANALVYDREIPDDSVVEHAVDGEMLCRPRRAKHCMA